MLASWVRNASAGMLDNQKFAISHIWSGEGSVNYFVHIQKFIIFVTEKHSCCMPTGSYLSSFLQNTLKTNQVEINTDNRTLRPIAKLKEPRDLFALPKELDCPQQAARWPAECQVCVNMRSC
jgi:hypothetical protein